MERQRLMLVKENELLLPTKMGQGQELWTLPQQAWWHNAGERLSLLCHTSASIVQIHGYPLVRKEDRAERAIAELLMANQFLA